MRGELPRLDQPCEVILRVDDEDLCLVAEVAWRVKRGPDALMGLRLVGVTHDQRQGLRRLLRSLSERGPRVAPVPPELAPPRPPAWMLTLALLAAAACAISFLL